MSPVRSGLSAHFEKPVITIDGFSFIVRSECRGVGILIGYDVTRHGKTANRHLLEMWIGEEALALWCLTVRPLQ